MTAGLCGACHVNRVPRIAFWIPWCDPCLIEFLAGSMTPEEFATRKRAGGTIP